MKNDALPIEGIDYVELYVGNAKQASYFYKNGFGFSPVAYSGPETESKTRHPISCSKATSDSY